MTEIKRSIFKKSLFSFVLLLMLTAILAVTGLSCDKKLTREKAAKMIVAKMGYPQMVEEEVLLAWSPWATERLKERGWIVIVAEYSPSGLRFRVSVTDEGRKQGLRRGAREYWHGVAGKVCDKVFVGVTGMKDVQKGIKEVEFAWTYANQTPFCSLLFSKSRYMKGDTIRGRCRFALYDDGWRIEEIEEGERR
jgi:hypothetical protein